MSDAIAGEELYAGDPIEIRTDGKAYCVRPQSFDAVMACDAEPGCAVWKFTVDGRTELHDIANDMLWSPVIATGFLAKGTAVKVYALRMGGGPWLLFAKAK